MITGAYFALGANIAIALLIAGTLLILARLAGAPQAVRWFGISYLVGALTPTSELLLRIAPMGQGLFLVTSPASFTAAFLIMAGALARYYGVPLRRRWLVLLFAAAVVLRLATLALPRESAASAILFQLPFVICMALCAGVILRGARGPLDRLLSGLFAIGALHFMLKPPAALLLGAGATARDYVTSGYALFSQAASGLVLVAVALGLILVVVVDTVTIMHRVADHDGLSGLLNRRAFDREAAARLDRAPLTVLMFDIDHFKSVNDTHGHAAGDRVIQAVAAMLREAMPAEAVIGRTGGEEFSVLVAGLEPEVVASAAERLRAGVAARPVSDLALTVTVSGGMAVRLSQQETLSSLMARADLALYAAKAGGRDQVVIADP